MKTQKGMNLLLIIFGVVFCVYSLSFSSIFYFSYHCTAFFRKEVFYGIALHSSMMHRFSQGSFAEMDASTRMLPRIPILPMEDIEATGGKFLSGKVTTPSGEQIGVCVYTTPTYKILKEEKYRPILITVGLGGVLEMLPPGIDLQACADFMATYDASSQIGTFTRHDGLEIQVHITSQLVADALQMDLTTPPTHLKGKRSRSRRHQERVQVQ